VANTIAVTVEKKAGEQYDRVVAYQLGERPPRLEDPDAAPEYEPAGMTCGIPDDEIPF